MSSHVRVEPAPITSPEAQALIAALNDTLTGEYPPDNNFFELPADEVDGDRGVFVIARAEGVVAGCGAVRFLDDTTAEVKRMFVVPEQRGRGIGALVLRVLERWASERGALRLVLETGDKQLEALRLYERAGFAVIPCWGEYARSETSLCYEKPLPGRLTPDV